MFNTLESRTKAFKSTNAAIIKPINDTVVKLKEEQSKAFELVIEYDKEIAKLEAERNNIQQAMFQGKKVLDKLEVLLGE